MGTRTRINTTIDIHTNTRINVTNHINAHINMNIHVHVVVLEIINIKFFDISTCAISYLNLVLIWVLAMVLILLSTTI